MLKNNKASGSNIFPVCDFIANDQYYIASDVCQQHGSKSFTFIQNS